MGMEIHSFMPVLWTILHCTIKKEEFEAVFSSARLSAAGHNGFFVWFCQLLSVRRRLAAKLLHCAASSLYDMIVWCL
jgi:hypothetical protein